MSTKMDRVVLFVKHLEDDLSIEDVVYHLENSLSRFLEFVTVKDIKRADIGKWSDDHELNKITAKIEQYEKYYPEIKREKKLDI